MEDERELRTHPEMPSRSKATTANAATSKKRPLSKNASSSIAKRPSTQGGFLLSSDDDEESADDDDNDCYLVYSKPVDQRAVISPKPIHQQAVVPSKVPASMQEPLPTEPTQAPVPTKQLNKARLSVLLGRNKKLKQTASKASHPTTATHSPKRSEDVATGDKLAESSNKRASLPQMLGSSLLGIKQTAAPRPKLPYAAVSVVEPQHSFLQQNKSTYALGGIAPIRAIDDSKGKEAALVVRPHGGIGKEEFQQKSIHALKPAALQAPKKIQSDSKTATHPQSTAPSGAKPGSKAQELAKPKVTILHSQPQHKENEPKIKQQAPEAHSRCTEFTKPVSCSSEQPFQNDAPNADNDEASDVATLALQKPVPPLIISHVPPKIKQENMKSKDTVAEGSEKASRTVLAKISPPVTNTVTPDEVTDASSEVLVLPRCELSKDAQPYFEYSIFRKDWSSDQDESEASNKEIVLLRFTNVLEANAQAERLFQSGKYLSYMIIECSTKRDEHGCIILTSSIAPFDHPTHKHHTKIYVQRDYVSKFANQTPQSLKGTTFISDTAYILRLFRLVEVPDAVNSNSPDSDLNSPLAAACDPVRVCHPHDRPEVYTTLEAANRAAKNLQVELTHKKDLNDAMTKAFQEQDLMRLNEKVRELEAARDGEERFWRSKFNPSGLEGDKLELVVEKVGICGPRNI